MAARVLVINPNTTSAVTDQVLACCRGLHGDVHWDGATSRLGAPYIASELAYALASHAVLEAYADHYDGQDAVLLACFGDPGLLALREIAAVPVIGLAQSSLAAAAQFGRFGIVTGGKAWEPMLARFARAHGLDTNLVGICTVALTGADIAAAPHRAIDLLLPAAQRALQAGAEAILLGGAALAGLGAALGSRLPVPVLDNVALAARAVVDAALQRGPKPRAALPALRMAGVGPALSALLEGG